MASDRNGTLYVGVTSDLHDRIVQHKTGELGGFTKQYGCKTLVWYEPFTLITDAIKREKQLKKYFRRWKINLIEADNPQWRDLAHDLLDPWFFNPPPTPLI